MTPLGREIAAMIAADGPMRLDRYMALCLSHPAHGYYETRDPFGPRGDFVTAPEISQMFGELIGLWAAEVWRRMGSPARVALVELGPGRGTLMADMLRAARAAPGFGEAIEARLVETSLTLRDVQARTLETAEAPAEWFGTIEEALSEGPHQARSEAVSRDHAQNAPSPPLESPLPAIVVANEFFDALPVRQFVRTGGGWRERLVGLGPDGGLAFGLAPDAPADLTLPDAPDGTVREFCPAAVAIAAHVASHVALHGGACLAIDYGYVAGAGDTLQALKDHAFADPLEGPGEADLTAHVDFAALGAAAASGGAAVMRPISQGELLERLGLAARARRLSSTATPVQRAAIEAAVARLTDRAPRGMGALFKALAFGDPRLDRLPAFEHAPLSQGTQP